VTLKEIQEILVARNLRPLKSLGQNFLHDSNLCREIAEAVEAAGSEKVVEVGPGLGALTEELLALGHEVSAIEIDHGLASFLREHFAQQDRFSLIEGDALEVLPQLDEARHVVGNLPYNVSTPLLATCLQRRPLPLSMVFTVQKEMADRFVATFRTKAYGALSVYLQTYYHCQPLRTLGPGSFYPRPTIDSTVVRFQRLPDPALPADEALHFYGFVRRAFAQRRKKLRNTIGVDSDLRPEHLTVADWNELYAESKRTV
jgi:16S rRNA (adenine1518-N6/adenine1519-N6)-dimethyltransferase